MPARHRRPLACLAGLALAATHLLLTATSGYAASAADGPSPTSTAPTTGPMGLPPFDPVTYGMWGLSAILAVAAMIYAMNRERRKM